MQSIPDTFIARHIAQSIWQTAMVHPPAGFFGLLGEHARARVDQAVMPVTARDLQAGDEALDIFVRHTLDDWQRQGIRPRGALYGNSDTTQFAAVESAIHACQPASAAEPLVHVVISLDTKGRLDSRGWILEDGKTIFAPLVMVEDGQTADIR